MLSAYVHSAQMAGAGAHRASLGDAVAIAILVGLGLFGVLFTVIVTLIRPPSDHRDGADGDSGPGGGGRGPRREGPDGPQPSGGDPEWWPEFERQFDEYVAVSTRLACAHKRQ
jgi:hypothetical protein